MDYFGPVNDDPRQEAILYVEAGDFIVYARCERLKVGEKPYPPFQLAEMVGATERTDASMAFLYEAWERPWRIGPGQSPTG